MSFMVGDRVRDGTRLGTVAAVFPDGIIVSVDGDAVELEVQRGVSRERRVEPRERIGWQFVMRAGEPDPCVVDTVPLAAVLREFVDDYRRERPSTAGQYRGPDRGPDVEPFSPYAALAFETGLPEKEIRRVRDPGRNPHTELRVADALVASIGRPVTFSVMANPKLPAGRGGECCGGSET